MPADEVCKAWFYKIKSGSTVKANVVILKNYKFRNKFFAMLHVAFDNHDWPEIETPYGPARTSFESFRAYVTVKSGHYETDVTPEGNFRPRPKSIAFANMEEAEFAQVYSDVLDVILAKFLTGWKEEDMARAVENFILDLRDAKPGLP